MLRSNFFCAFIYLNSRNIYFYLNTVFAQKGVSFKNHRNVSHVPDIYFEAFDTH